MSLALPSPPPEPSPAVGQSGPSGAMPGGTALLAAAPTGARPDLPSMEAQARAGFEAYIAETQRALGLLLLGAAAWAGFGFYLTETTRIAYEISSTGRMAAYLACGPVAYASVALREALTAPPRVAPYLAWTPDRFGLPLSHAHLFGAALALWPWSLALMLKLGGWGYLDFLVLTLIGAAMVALQWPKPARWENALVASRFVALKLRSQTEAAPR